MGGINEEAVSAALANIGLTIDEASALLDNGYNPSQIVTMSPAEHQTALQSISGGWMVIAQADSPQNLKSINPSISEIPSGTEGIVTVDFPWYIGGSLTARIFDAAGAEQTIGNYLKPAHSEVLDVYEKDGKGYVRFRVTGSPALPIIIAIGAGLVALGITAAAITVAIKAPSDLFSPNEWGNAFEDLGSATSKSLLSFAPIALIALGAVFLLTQGGKQYGNQSDN